MVDRFEIWVIGISACVGVGTTFIAMRTATEKVDSSFYATVVQILPVFLVALALEQRLVDRLGVGEEQYVGLAEDALQIGIGYRIESEEENYGVAQHLLETFEARPRFHWVSSYVEDFAFPGNPELEPDIPLLARAHYKRERQNEIVLVAVALAVIVVGEIVGIFAMLHGGSSRCSPYLGLTLGCAIGAIVAITLSGARELIGSLRR